MRHLACLVVFLAFASAAALAEKDPAADPKKVDADYHVQGEYAGELTLEDGRKQKYGAQVVALGDGKFKAAIYPGGLPGDGWDKQDGKLAAAGQTADGVTTFTCEGHAATLKDKAFTVTDESGKEVGKLARVERKSPSLGAPVPEGGIVLFDGKNADEWQGGKVTEEGLLQQGTTSKRKFKDFLLHVEFMTPYEPKKSGQGRGNSGVYLQGRYEVQVLDSFGLEGKNNEAGGIYTVSDPMINMCFPPLTWQTYDIEYTAARFDGGRKLANAKITVKHNGVLVQRDVEAKAATTAAPNKEGPEDGPIHLQDHGNPVRYRNIWAVPK
jgi:hypothetical protein